MDEHTFRVDEFRVPAQARREFLETVRATHDLLRSQPGFVRDSILEQTSGLGEFNFVTIVECEDTKAMEPARRAVVALHERMKCDPREMFARLGIRPDLATYQRVALANSRGL